MTIIRILLVDDEKNLLSTSKLYIEKIDKNINIITAHSAKEALRILSKEHIDVIVSDYQMPEINGLEFLEKVREMDYELPFIIFTGRGREEVAIQALNLGADYYLQKGGDIQSQFIELINLINKIIDKKKSEIALRKSEEKFSKAFQYSSNSIAISKSRSSEFLDVNDKFLKMLNYSRDEVIGNNSYDLKLWAKKEDQEYCKKLIINTGDIIDFETVLLAKDARLIPVLISATLIDIEGEECILSVTRDISEITQALEQLKENEHKYRILFENSPIALFQMNLYEAYVIIDDLVYSGITDVLGYLKNNPEIMINITKAMKIEELNRAAIELIGADSREDIPRFFDLEFFSKNEEIFLSFIEFIISNEESFEKEFNSINFRGEEARIYIRISLSSDGSKERFPKLFISIINLQKQFKAKQFAL